MTNNDKEESFTNININWYPGHMVKTKRLIKENIDKIDIVIEIIDARIPLSSKLPDIYDYIKDKARIIIMSKYDLCDKEETNKWINYYEKTGVTVLALDLQGNQNLNKLFKVISDLMLPINEKRLNKGMLKKRAHILVMGIPNVGKSTLINKIVGRKATVVGNKPGVTKQLNWIRINEEVELLDTPGILWPKFENQKTALNLASLTAIKEEVLPLFDVATYILKTLETYYPKILKERFKIEHISEEVTETFNIIGKNRGCLIKGGLVDYDKVITSIINDIKQGIVKGITFDRYLEENK